MRVCLLTFLVRGVTAIGLATEHLALPGTELKRLWLILDDARPASDTDDRGLKSRRFTISLTDKNLLRLQMKVSSRAERFALITEHCFREEALWDSLLGEFI